MTSLRWTYKENHQCLQQHHISACKEIRVGKRYLCAASVFRQESFLLFLKELPALFRREGRDRSTVHGKQQGFHTPVRRYFINIGRGFDHGFLQGRDMQDFEHGVKIVDEEGTKHQNLG